MSTTLSYGYIKPQSGDKGNTFFGELEQNIQRVNDHTHDGSNSAKLTGQSVDAVNQTLSSGSWVLVSGSTYRQLVTMPGTLQFDTSNLQFQINSGANAGDLFYPSVEKQSANTYYIYINDNSVDVLVKYS